MTKFFTLTLILLSSILVAQSPCSGGTAAGYPCDGITLQSKITVASMGAIEAQDSWGWTDSTTGKEYAIVGLNNGTAFIDISNPTSPIYLGKLPNHGGAGYYSDVKIYNNHAYIVSDDAGAPGMQIFDLTKLRSVSSPPQTFTQDGLYNANSLRTVHNIFINQASGRLYLLGSNRNGGGPRVLDLSNPTNPTLVRNISTYGYCHDAQVLTYNGPDPDHQGKEIMIGSFSGSNDVIIIDVDNPGTIIGQISYTDQEYTHQGWFTEDKRFFIVGDELDEGASGFNTRTLVFDLNDLDNPSLHYTHYGSTPSTDHNGYVRGNRYYLANYRAGMRVLKVDGLYDSPPSMTEVNYFDTLPNSNSAGTNGLWNVYPYFESGNLLATGFGEISSNTDGGVYILKDPNYDNQAPVAVTQNYIATLANSGSVTVTAAQVGSLSTDNKGIISYKIDGINSMTFTCDDVDTPKSVLLTVKDDYGFEDSIMATITVIPNETKWTGGSWDDGTPGIGSLARITSNYSTSDDGNIDACTCQVDANNALQVDAGNYIKVQKDITVKTDGSLLVAHTANVVQTDADAEVIREAGATIDVALTTPALIARDIMVLGSPMDTETKVAFDNAHGVFQHNTEDFDPYIGTPPVNGVNFLDNDFNDFEVQTGILNPAEGYYVRPSYVNDGTYNYNYTVGTLNSGNISYNAYFGDDKQDSPNILANPYASAINASQFIDDNPIVSEVYFWEHNTTPSGSIPGPDTANFNMQDVSIYNGTMGTPASSGGTTPNGVIATGQGFGIKANSGGLVTFTNDMRLTSGNTTLRAPDSRDLLWLKVQEDTYSLGSTAGLGFLSQATDGIDARYDSDKLGTIVSLYSHLQDGSEKLSIQGMSNFDPMSEIPFGFSTLIDQDNHEYTISLSAVEGPNISTATVFLRDNLTQITTNLSEGNYRFNAATGDYDNRFTLMFSPFIAGLNDATLENSIIVHPNPTSDIIIADSFNSEILNTEIYDVRGRRIVKTIAVESNKHTLDVSALETGVYYITINTKDGSVTKKIIKM